MAKKDRTSELYAADDLVIFVGHSGDARGEAEAIQELTATVQQELSRLNSVAGPNSKFKVVKIFLWETDAVPDVGGQQTTIDPHLARANIGVFVFRDRVGKITWEELDYCRQRETPVPVIAVFPKLPPAEGMDEETVAEAWFDLVKKRRELSSGWQGENSKAVLPTDRYRDRDHMREIVLTNVSKVLHSLLRYAADSFTEDIAAVPTAIPSGYFSWLREQCEEVGLGDMQDTQGTAVRLNHVYVPLTTSGREEKKGTEQAAFTSDREQKPVLLLDELANSSLYVAGAPGSGKSTFCRWVAWLACTGSMPNQPIAMAEGYRETFPEVFRNRLPLLVPLRDFWTALPAAHTTLSRGKLEKALFAWIDEESPGELTSACLKHQLENGNLLLILDGVDEVPLSQVTEGGESHPRALLLSGLIDALKTWTKTGNRVLLTSRPYGINGGDEKRLHLQAAPISELDASLQELLVKRWFLVLAGKPKRGEQLAAEMLSHIRGRQELSPLVGNPLLLTAMCVIYNQGKRLPKDKHDLYDRILDCVLHNRYGDDQRKIDLVRKRLSVIAYGMHTGEGLDEERGTPQAEATYDELHLMIQRFRELSPAVETDYTATVDIREDLLNRSGILLPKGDKRAGYYHFTLQDFLAAQLLLERVDDLADLFRRRAVASEWRSTLSFVFSSLMARNTLPDKGIRLLETLIKPLTLAQLPLAVVVADCLEILSGHPVQLHASYIEQFRQLCLDAIAGEVSIPERQQLALALGRLGDPRVIEDLRDHDNMDAWAMIPADTYQIGDDPNHEDYKYWKPLEVQSFDVTGSFWITRFPVTNGQFRLFMVQGGYKNESLWSDEGWAWKKQNPDIREPRFWHDTTWNSATQPVVGVSYWEAEAFAKWCGGVLPSERQWESAARGPDNFIYPWGPKWKNGICNSAESKLGGTSVVGIFPQSQSLAFKLHDMAGNVWEWCADVYDSRREKSAGCVLRGGSWDIGARLCRAAIRIRYFPEIRIYVVGFRVLYSRQDLP